MNNIIANIQATAPQHRRISRVHAREIAIANGIIVPRPGKCATAQDNQQGPAVVGQEYPRGNHAF